MDIDPTLESYDRPSTQGHRNPLPPAIRQRGLNPADLYPGSMAGRTVLWFVETGTGGEEWGDGDMVETILQALQIARMPQTRYPDGPTLL